MPDPPVESREAGAGTCYRSTVPDDERTRRRLSDATKGRIADLASGWTVDPDPPAPELDATPAPEPEPTPRKRQKTMPPPPPGSEARRALETAILEATETPAPAPAKANAPIAAMAITPSAATAGKPGAAPPGSATRIGSSTGASARVGSSTGATAAIPGPRVGSSTGVPAAIPAAGASSAIPQPMPTTRTAPSTSPPPPPRAAKSATQPPPLPPGARRPTAAEGSGAIAPRVPPLPPTAAPVAPNAPASQAPTSAPGTVPRAAREVNDASDNGLAVPVGEFEGGGGGTLLEPDKLRIAHSQATIKRDASNALLGVAEAPLTVVKETPVEVLLTESAEHGRGDPTAIDSATQRFERGDPTNLGRPDATLASVAGPSAVHTAAGRLRTVAQLRRQRGLFGDVRYVATAIFGVRRARRELVDLEGKQETRQASRRRYLLTLGRAAVTSEGFDNPALGIAREKLSGVEDERARHTGQVVAADQELQRVKRDREAAAKQSATNLAAVDAELAELQKRLEPLIKEQAAVTRRGAQLRESLRAIEKKIADTTAQLVTVKGPKQDPAAIQAELATLKADKVAVQRDEPKIAADLDALNPKIAAIESKRAESQKRKIDLVKAEEDDQRRAEELLAAIGAKRKVMDRAAGDAEVLRDKILFELGERLYVDRPPDLAPEMAPIDSIDVELGEADRRVMELREILSSIDKAKLWRGIAMIVLALAAVGGFTAWLLYMLL